MDRCEKINFMGAERLATLNSRAIVELKADGIDVMKGWDANDFGTLVKIIYHVLQAGDKWAKRCGAENPEPPTMDEILDGTDLTDFEGIDEKLVKVIQGRREVEAKPNRKNAGAAQSDK